MQAAPDAPRRAAGVATVVPRPHAMQAAVKRQTRRMAATDRRPLALRFT